MSDWKPIETAPKDGTIVDLWTRIGERWTDCHWNVDKGDWLRWGLDSWGGNGWQRIVDPLTHWMPLPPPPTAIG